MTDEAENTEKNKTTEPRGWNLVRFDALKNPPIWFVAPLYAIGSLFVVTVLILVGYGLFASFQLAHESVVGEFKDRIEAAKVFFPIILALVGGPLLIWRVITAHVQARAAAYQADVAQEGLFTSLFTKAVEQLGMTRDETTEDGKTLTRPNLEVRLGAIYAFDRIARDSERDHWPIMEVLCAYVRNPQNSGPPNARPESIKETKSKQFEAWLKSLRHPRVDVQAALTVIGERPAQRRMFEDQRELRLNLEGANLQSAKLRRSYFNRANFRNARLDDSWFLDAELKGANFLHSNAARARFSGGQLDGAVFFATDLFGAIFYEAELVGAAFSHANLTDVSFDKANLSGAEFNKANLERTSFDGATLAGAWLFETDLSKAQSIDPITLRRAFGDASTTLPIGLTRPTVWVDRVLSWPERRDFVARMRAGQEKEPGSLVAATKFMLL